MSSVIGARENSVMYVWKDNRIVTIAWSDRSAWLDELYVIDPTVTHESGRYGMFVFNGCGEWHWVSVAKNEMPKEFLLSALLEAEV